MWTNDWASGSGDRTLHNQGSGVNGSVNRSLVHYTRALVNTPCLSLFVCLSECFPRAAIYSCVFIPLDIYRTRSAVNVLYIYLNTFRISLHSTKMIHSTERYSEIENKRDKRKTEIHAQSIHSSPRIEVFHGCAADGPLSLDKYPSPPFSITYCDIQYP